MEYSSAPGQETGLSFIHDHESRNRSGHFSPSMFHPLLFIITLPTVLLPLLEGAKIKLATFMVVAKFMLFFNLKKV
jgi:hypothetical protein